MVNFAEKVVCYQNSFSDDATKNSVTSPEFPSDAKLTLTFLGAQVIEIQSSYMAFAPWKKEIFQLLKFSDKTKLCGMISEAIL